MINQASNNKNINTMNKISINNLNHHAPGSSPEQPEQPSSEGRHRGDHVNSRRQFGEGAFPKTNALSNTMYTR